MILDSERVSVCDLRARARVCTICHVIAFNLLLNREELPGVEFLPGEVQRLGRESILHLVHHCN